MYYFILGDSTIAYYNENSFSLQAEIPTCINDWLKDKICDDRNNVPECYFDMNDCCNQEANFDFCSDCQCKDKDSPYYYGQVYQVQTTTQPANHFLNCENSDMVYHGIFADGICDEILNDAACLYDGGDCCLSDSLSKCHTGGKDL